LAASKPRPVFEPVDIVSRVYKIKFLIVAERVPVMRTISFVAILVQVFSAKLIGL
jgi:hypothetical protein